MKYETEAVLKAGNEVSIINMSSDAAIAWNHELYAYSVSQADVRLMTKSAVLHLAGNEFGIQVNSIHPDYMHTELINEEPDPEAVIANIPLKRVDKPEVVGHGAVYLPSNDSSFLTGTELFKDGSATVK